MIKKIIIVVGLIAFINSGLLKNDAYIVNAGIIKWGVSKAISSIIKIIFSEAKDRVVNKAKEKLFIYLRKHPKYIDYTTQLIQKEINKHPKYSDRGNQILCTIKKIAKNKITSK